VEYVRSATVVTAATTVIGLVDDRDEWHVDCCTDELSLVSC